MGIGYSQLDVSAEEVSGPILKLWKVSRMDMGAYMCIARNGVPPAVSKRIELGIDCKISCCVLHYYLTFLVSPMIWVPAQLVGAYHGDMVTLTCFVEAHPASLNYWEKDGVMIHANDHYDYSQERGSPAYKVSGAIKMSDWREHGKNYPSATRPENSLSRNHFYALLVLRTPKFFFRAVNKNLSSACSNLASKTIQGLS